MGMGIGVFALASNSGDSLEPDELEFGIGICKATASGLANNSEFSNGFSGNVGLESFSAGFKRFVGLAELAIVELIESDHPRTPAGMLDHGPRLSAKASAHLPLAARIVESEGA